MKKSSFWSKKMTDMTVADTMKFTGIVTVASVVIGLIPLAIGYWDDISDWFYDKFKRFKRKEAKPALSTEEEDDWVV